MAALTHVAEKYYGKKYGVATAIPTLLVNFTLSIYTRQGELQADWGWIRVQRQGVMATMHAYLRQHHGDMDPVETVIYGPSTTNQVSLLMCRMLLRGWFFWSNCRILRHYCSWFNWIFIFKEQRMRRNKLSTVAGYSAVNLFFFFEKKKIKKIFNFIFFFKVELTNQSHRNVETGNDWNWM